MEKTPKKQTQNNMDQIKNHTKQIVTHQSIENQKQKQIKTKTKNLKTKNKKEKQPKPQPKPEKNTKTQKPQRTKILTIKENKRIQ